MWRLDITDCLGPCRSLDRDQNGAITSEELQRALSKLGVPITEATAAQMVELIDTDQSSDVSYEEFRHFALLLPSSQVGLCSGNLSHAQDNFFPTLPFWICPKLAPEWQEAAMQVSAPGIVLDWMDCASWVDGVEYRLGARIPPREPFQRLLAGGIAGAFSRTGDCLCQMAG